MREAGVRRVPVVGLRSELVGVLSLDDVLEALASQLTNIAAAIRNEQQLERSVRP
jgi:CBS domain-containing protein